VIKIRRATEIFIATRSYFEGTYTDPFSRDFRIKNIPDTHALQYEKLARKFVSEEELIFFLFTAFMVKDVRYVGDLFCDEVEDNYKRALKYKLSLTYQYKKDISVLSEADIMNSGSGLFRKALLGHLNIETMAIVADVLGLLPLWEKKFKDDPFKSVFVAKVKKYLKIMPYDQKLIVSGMELQFNHRKDDNVS
jgi:hypothetical protein